MALVCLAVVCPAVLGAAPAWAQKVGTAAAVNPASSGAPPGGSVRTLTLGAEVVHNERIHTDAKGSVQLLFVDRTSMNIGPSSDVTIDEYVYDPNAKTGKLVVTVGKGLMRFVGGQVSHTGEATVKTPSASIGIRGGTGFIEVNGDHTRTVNLFGRQTVTYNGGQTTIYRPNFMFDVFGNLVPVPPILAPYQVIAAFNALLQAHFGQNGGSGGHVTPQLVQALADAYNVTQPIGTSSNPVQTPNTYLHILSMEPSWPTYFQTSTVWQTTLLAGQQGQQSAAAGATVGQLLQGSILPGPTGPTSPSGPPSLPTGPFLMSMTNCCSQESGAPYLPATIAFTGGNSLNSPLVGYGNDKTAVQNGANAGQTLQFGINLTGDRASQQSWFLVAAGNVTQTSGSPPQINGLFFGTSRQNSTLPMSYALGGFGSSNVAVTNSGVPGSMTVTQNPAAVSVINLNSASTYTFEQTATATQSPGAGFPGPSGTNRPAVTLSGYAGGLVQTVDSHGVLSAPYIITGSTNTPGDVSVTLNPQTSQTQATFKIASVNPAGTSPLTTATYNFDPATSTSAYVDYNYFGSVSISGSGTGTPSAARVNGQPALSSTHAFVNIPASVAQAVLTGPGGIPSGQVCQCDYTRWGMWSSDSFRTSGTGLAQDVGHANFWVAGQLPSISEVPASGIATYAGHVIAQVWNGTNQYISGGSFTNTVNFGTRSGWVTAGLDGGVYKGTVNLNVTDPRKFSGNLPITISSSDSAGLPYTSNMSLNGSFFRGVSSPVGEMGGNVTVTAPGFPNYYASGIFAARMQ